MSRIAFPLVVLGSVLWGTDSLFRRPLTASFSPVTIVFLEHCILVVVILPWLHRSRRELAALRIGDWSALAFIAVGGSVLATSLFTYAIKYGNPSVTVLLQKSQPFLTAFLARATLGERPGRHFWRCLAPALVGATLVSLPDLGRGMFSLESRPSCIAAALGAALLWGSCTVFGRYVVPKLPPLALTGCRFVLALPILVLLFVMQPEAERSLPASWEQMIMLSAMALIPGLAALAFYYRGLRSTEAAMASVAELAFPVTAVAVNWLVLGIGIVPTQVFGGVLLVGSVSTLAYRNATGAARRGAAAA